MRRLLRQNPCRPVYTANASNIRVLVISEPYAEYSMYSIYPSSSYLEPVADTRSPGMSAVMVPSILHLDILV